VKQEVCGVLSFWKPYETPVQYIRVVIANEMRNNFRNDVRNYLLIAAAVCGIGAVHVQAQALALPAGPGKVTTEKVCGACHGAELMIGRQESRETWGAIVDDMVQRGAQGTQDELYEVVDYLATNFSKTSPVTKINVNQLTAADLQKVLRLPEAQATAIVKYREEKGNFKSSEELAKVPGVDAAKITSSKNRLSF
jgi:competence protein ComEA